MSYNKVIMIDIENELVYIDNILIKYLLPYYQDNIDKLLWFNGYRKPLVLGENETVDMYKKRGGNRFMYNDINHMSISWICTESVLSYIACKYYDSVSGIVDFFKSDLHYNKLLKKITKGRQTGISYVPDIINNIDDCIENIEYIYKNVSGKDKDIIEEIVYNIYSNLENNVFKNMEYNLIEFDCSHGNILLKDHGSIYKLRYEEAMLNIN